jgi:hypothetical protein
LKNFSSYGILWAQKAFSSKWDTHTEFFDVFLQLVVFDLALDAGQLHSVVITEFGRLVPIGLFVFPFRMAVKNGGKSKSWKKIKTVNELMLKSCASLVRDGLLLPRRHD